LNSLFQGSQPPFDFYTWPPQAEPESAALSVPTKAVQNISALLNGDKLTWDVPPGEWIIQRLAMVPTGAYNTPAPPDSTGPEVDKMSRELLRVHFDAYVGNLLKRMPAADRKALKHVVVDSYEVGSQNWTEGFGEAFKVHYGYDATPFLPVLSGRIIGSAEQSNRFLWDMRRFVADRIASEYVGGLRDISREHGLRSWQQNYGWDGFSGETLQYGGQVEEISGEFWAGPDHPYGGNVELRDASSAAHIYGLPAVYAEAWTGGPAFSNTPAQLKRRGDWAFCQGVSQMVLHVNIAQPDERRPGISAWFGTEFNRHNTWFNQSKSFFDYLTRSHFMLQQGKYVADVAYFIGEDTPKMSGLQQPVVPGGYSYDFINADVIINRLQMKNGRFTLPDGMSYRLIVIPDGVSMRPETLKKLRDLVAQGGAVWGAPPTKSPSLQNYPACDAEIGRLAAQLWAKCDGVKTQSAAFGKGRVFRGASLVSALQQVRVQPDVVG
ncbi:glycoside hydrolase family 2, partial [bacterium]